VDRLQVANSIHLISDSGGIIQVKPQPQVMASEPWDELTHVQVRLVFKVDLHCACRLAALPVDKRLHVGQS